MNKQIPQLHPRKLPAGIGKPKGNVTPARPDPDRTRNEKKQAKKTEQAKQEKTQDKATSQKQVNSGRWVKGQSGNPKGKRPGSRNKTVTVTVRKKPAKDNHRLRGAGPGRPRGSKNKATILREAIQRNAPDLFKRLLKVARSGDVVALKTVLGPLLPKGNQVPWTFGKLDTPDAIMQESERVLRAMEEGTLTIDEAKAIQDLLDQHIARATSTGDRRSAFEEEQIALALIRDDPQCRQLAQALVTRFDELEQQALTDGRLTAPAQHKLIEVARAGSRENLRD